MKEEAEIRNPAIRDALEKLSLQIRSAQIASPDISRDFCIKARQSEFDFAATLLHCVNRWTLPRGSDHRPIADLLVANMMRNVDAVQFEITNSQIRFAEIAKKLTDKVQDGDTAAPQLAALEREQNELSTRIEKIEAACASRSSDALRSLCNGVTKCIVDSLVKLQKEKTPAIIIQSGVCAREKVRHALNSWLAWKAADDARTVRDGSCRPVSSAECSGEIACLLKEVCQLRRQLARRKAALTRFNNVLELSNDLVALEKSIT